MAKRQLLAAGSAFCLLLLAIAAVGPAASVCPNGSYGPHCNLSCAEFCDLEANCNSSIGGGCTKSCQKGWEGFPLCTTACRPNWFSFNCSERCHCANATEVCDRKNGNCQSGCQPEWAESSCNVRMPEIMTPPWIVESGCGRFLVAFRPFNASVDIGVGYVSLYQIESDTDSRGIWIARANVTTSVIVNTWIDVGSENRTLEHRFRVSILYRSPDFYERFAPASNESSPGQVNCLETSPGTQVTTPSTAATAISSGSTTDSAATSTASAVTDSGGTTLVTEPSTSSSASSDTTTTNINRTSPDSTSEAATSAAPADPGSYTALIVTLCVLLFLLLCIALAAALYWLHRRRASDGKKSPWEKAPTGVLGNLAEPRSARYWTGIRELVEPRRPVFNESLAATLEAAASTGPNSAGLLSFQDEYNSLPGGYQPQKSIEVARRLENASKNATPQSLPYDFNRVKFVEDENVYYNAAIVKGYVRRDAYIAAQSPRDASSAELFWKAVLEHNVAQVVAAGGSHEPLAFRYWPDASEQTLNCGSVTIACEWRRQRHEYIVHRLRVNSVRVTHYQLVSRHNDTLGLVALYTAVRAAARIEDGPMLVHCRSGIGPACVFVGLDWLMQQAARENGGVSVLKCARDLRRSRPNALPDPRHYALLYDALFEAFLRRGFLAVPAASAIDAFMETFDSDAASPSSATPMKEQLDLLTRLGPSLDDPDRVWVADRSQITFDSHQESGAVSFAATPVSSKPDDAAAVAATRNAFWLDVLRRRPAAVVCLDGAAPASEVVFPSAALFAVDKSDEQPVLELPDLQILVPPASNEPASDIANSAEYGCKQRTLCLRPRNRSSKAPGATDDALMVDLLTLSWAAEAAPSGENPDEESIKALAKVVAALTSTKTPCLLVDADWQRCGLLAVALQAWRQLMEDGYADMCAAARRNQRRRGVALGIRQYRLIHRCLQLLAAWRRNRPLPKRRRRRRRGKNVDNVSEGYEDFDNEKLWSGLASTLESSGDELESSIYDYCQLPLRPGTAAVYLNDGDRGRSRSQDADVSELAV